MNNYIKKENILLNKNIYMYSFVIQQTIYLLNKVYLKKIC